MNSLITVFLIVAITGIVIRILINIIIKDNSNELINNLKEDHIIIHLPNIYKWIGLICSMLFLSLLILMIIFPNDTAEIWVGVLFSIFIILGVYMIFATYHWKIHIYRNDEYFIYVSSFGKKYKIYYFDIIDYKNGDNYIKIKTVRKSFYVDNKSTNIEFLLAMIKKNNVKELINENIPQT